MHSPIFAVLHVLRSSTRGGLSRDDCHVSHGICNGQCYLRLKVIAGHLAGLIDQDMHGVIDEMHKLQS